MFRTVSLPAIAVVAILLVPAAVSAWGAYAPGYGSSAGAVGRPGGPYYLGFGANGRYATPAYAAGTTQFGPNYMPRYEWSSTGAPRNIGFGSAYGTPYGSYPGDYHYGGTPSSTYSPGVYRGW